MNARKGLVTILLSCLRGAAYLSQLAAFMLILSVNNPQMLRVGKTTAILISSFVILQLVFTRIYGGYRIGEQKSRPIIYQMCLSSLMTDIITYIQMQILNVDEHSFSLPGTDIVLLMALLVVQAACVTCATYFGNYLYFSIHAPEPCCVVTASDGDRDIICAKLRIFDKQFVISDCVDICDKDLHAKIERNHTIILFRLPASVHQELVEYCYKCRKSIYFDLSIGDILAMNSGSFLLDDVPMTAHTSDGLTLRQRFIKRTFDIILSLVGLLLSAPIMLAAAIAIKVDDGGTVIYSQNRLTRGDRVFRIYKFRTMRTDSETDEHSAVMDDSRITRVGAFLRRFRIDELPQLVNILKGEMSIVGPRPEMLSNVNRYLEALPEYAYRCRVKAGLTGYAQIAGKYNTSPREKLMMDILYIENYSFYLDVKLILKTLTVFFKHDSTEAFKTSADERLDGGEE